MTKKNMRGMGRTFQRGRTWWIALYVHGTEHRESAKSIRESDAVRLLKRRIRELGSGRFVGPQEERVTFSDLAAGYLDDYKLQGHRSLESAAKPRAAHLQRFFGLDRAIDITRRRVRQYQKHRRADGAAGATINRETSALARMLRIAVEDDLLTHLPAFPAKLKENPPRKGFFEHAEYLAVRRGLPPAYQDVLDFAYYTGWRRSEILGLIWGEVDLQAFEIRLPPERSKSDKPRLLPLSDPLRAVIERRHAARRIDTPRVFHLEGKPIGDWRKRWHRACREAGLPGKRLHDCRRTAARNLRRAGVPEEVAMKLTGHATRDVFRRYNILTDDDIRAGSERLAAYVETLPTERIVVPIQAGVSAKHGQNTDNPGRVTRPGVGKLLKNMAGYPGRVSQLGDGKCGLNPAAASHDSATRYTPLPRPCAASAS